MLAGKPRDHIKALWPEHLEHLAPEGSRMGVGRIDETEGVVCNCGQILGFPMVQDEEEYLAGSDSEPDGYISDGRERRELMAEPEHHYDPTPATTAEKEAEEAPAPGGMLSSDSPSETPSDWHVANSPAGPMLVPDALDKQRGYHWGQRVDEAQAATWTTEDHNEAARLANQWADEQPPGPPPAVIPPRDHGVVQAEDPITARVVVIDPTLPYGPLDVEHQLLDINARIERGVHAQREWEERLFEAKTTFDLSYARAIIQAKGAADVRKAHALLECEDEYRALQLCETMVRAMRETMHNLRSLQSGMQTVARSVSESMRVPNVRP